MAERLSHVLVNFAVEGVEYVPIVGEQVHQETVFGHCITPLGCQTNTQKLQRENLTPPWCAIIFTSCSPADPKGKTRSLGIQLIVQVWMLLSQ